MHNNSTTSLFFSTYMCAHTRHTTLFTTFVLFSFLKTYSHLILLIFYSYPPLSVHSVCISLWLYITKSLIFINIHNIIFFYIPFFTCFSLCNRLKFFFASSCLSPHAELLNFSILRDIFSCHHHKQHSLQFRSGQIESVHIKSLKVPNEFTKEKLFTYNQIQQFQGKVILNF